MPVRISHVTTRNGDTGWTTIGGGKKVKKSDLRIRAIGAVDELVSHLGVVRALEFIDMVSSIEKIQQQLFDLGSILATPNGETSRYSITEQDLCDLEESTNKYNSEISPLESFVLPGSSLLNAQLHVSRTICRRAEVEVVTLNEIEPVNPLVIKYLNRLSDLLFVLARVAVKREGKTEILWTPRPS